MKGEHGRKPTATVLMGDGACDRGGSCCDISRKEIQDLIVRHCSPTLADLKCGNLFKLCSSLHDPQEVIEDIERRIADKGVRLRTIRTGDGGLLLYVYRPDRIMGRLQDPETERFLIDAGYDLSGGTPLVDQLVSRFGTGIPHEIGVFLGYPIGDVIGYIENKGRNCLCLGCWKAYSDPENAMKAFAMLKKCRRVYEKCHSNGTSLERLTVRTRHQGTVASCDSPLTCGQRRSC